MKGGRYLPSAQFTLMVGSLALAAGLIYAAELYTHPPQAPAELAAAAQPQDTNWEATLDQIEAAQATSSLLTASDPNAVNALLQAAQSPNVTDTVGRSLLINLSDAESQGLGSDVPTQDQLVAQATAQIASGLATTTTYTYANLTIVPTSSGALHAYGNAVMQALAGYPNASEQATFLAIDEIVEGHDESKVAALAEIGAAYQGAAIALLAVPVPQTLAPLHLEIINNLVSISATFEDMQTIGSDPVRGLEGFQNYESLMDAGASVFTNIAQELNKDGILFSKDEPGNAWSIFVAPTATPGSS